jgi:hypothetical protein
MLLVWSLVVVWVLILSVGALDGSQVALFVGTTLGLSGVRARVGEVVAELELETVRGGDAAGRVMSLAERVRLCRCGGRLRLVVSYVEVMRADADGSRLGARGFDAGWVERRLAGPLRRGRAFGGSGSHGSSLDAGSGRYCRKEVIVKRVVYYDDDGLLEGSLLSASGVAGDAGDAGVAGDARVALNMTGAAGVHRRVQDVVGEYPEYAGYRDGMQAHLVVVDVGAWAGSGLVSPTVGVLSDGDAIAVVSGKDGDAGERDGPMLQVHEIDAWLYGPGLGSVRRGEEVETACAVEAQHHAMRLVTLLDEARHLRFDPTSPAWEALLGGAGEGGKGGKGGKGGNGAFETASALRAILHSPEFGVEARMPAMHVVALMLPLGLPLVLQFASNLKVFLKRKKRRA